jgi:hypothetical protein
MKVMRYAGDSTRNLKEQHQGEMLQTFKKHKSIGRCLDFQSYSNHFHLAGVN